MEKPAELIKAEKEVTKKCEGNCPETHGQHKGLVKKVLVSGNGWQRMTFNYCENGIEEDRKRGFTVEEKTSPTA